MNAEARRAASSNFVVLVSRPPSSDKPSAGARLGITASRRIGGAVVRNRVKRRIREWFRRRDRRSERQLDIVVIARSGAVGLDQRTLSLELDGLLAQAVGS